MPSSVAFVQGSVIVRPAAWPSAVDAADEAPIVIYHSHTATEAYPSRTDIS